MDPLRSYVRALLEAAVAASQAHAAGLALVRRTNGAEFNEYVLYVPSIVEAMLVSGSIESDQIAKAVVGYMRVLAHQGNCWNAGEVKLSAAQKGYGPLMYQAAMNDYAGGLFPDRGSTSQAARAVWQRYAARADVEKSVFDDVKNPRTPQPEDDCPLAPGTTLDGDEAYLNQAYDAPGNAGGRSELMAAHQRFLADMAAKKFGKNVVEATIFNLGEEYFGMRYRDG